MLEWGGRGGEEGWRREKRSELSGVEGEDLKGYFRCYQLRKYLEKRCRIKCDEQARKLQKWVQ